jgi:hypothetical protein
MADAYRTVSPVQIVPGGRLMSTPSDQIREQLGEVVVVLLRPYGASVGAFHNFEDLRVVILRAQDCLERAKRIVVTQLGWRAPRTR